MDPFLRALGKLVRPMSKAQRIEVGRNIEQLFAVASKLGWLKGIPKLAALQLIGSIGTAMANDRTPEEWLQKFRARAELLEPEVLDLLPQARRAA